jgi:low affinity Fe/Cu permease
VKKLYDYLVKLCIKIADYFANPYSILLLPVVCVGFILLGGAESRLTLVLSILAITLTQMVLIAQNVDQEATKLQIAELVRSSPQARNIVIEEDLSRDDIHELKEEIEDDISK